MSLDNLEVMKMFVRICSDMIHQLCVNDLQCLISFFSYRPVNYRGRFFVTADYVPFPMALLHAALRFMS